MTPRSVPADLEDRPTVQDHPPFVEFVPASTDKLTDKGRETFLRRCRGLNLVENALDTTLEWVAEMVRRGELKLRS